MILFIILLVLLAVYQLSVRKAVGKVYPQCEKQQVKRLTSAPFHFTAWALFFVVCSYALSALTSMIGELFNVDTYIALFSGGWLGLILGFLRSCGFIGDIQEPMVLMQYRDTISVVSSVTLITCIVSVVILIAFCKEIKKLRYNGTAIWTYFYLSMAGALTAFLVFMWALYEFDDLLDHAVNFHMEEIYLFLTIIFIVSCGFPLFHSIQALKKHLALPQCQTMTWQKVLALIKINTDKGKQYVTEGQILGIALVLSFGIVGYVILSTLPVSAESEPIQSETTLPEAAVVQENSVNEDARQQARLQDEQNCIELLQKFYTASFDQIEEWGGFEVFETKRFIKYTSCWDSQVLTSNQDFGIGDACLRVDSIESNPKLANSFIVTVSCGSSEKIPTCVVLVNEDGNWKIDNIAYEPYDKVCIDYSKPASAYYVYEGCGDDEEQEDSEDFITL